MVTTRGSKDSSALEKDRLVMELISISVSVMEEHQILDN